MNPDHSDSIERRFHAALKALPDRPAPASLESRVLREIRRRAARPWWQKSFANWPLSLRIAFLACSGVAAAAVVAGFGAFSSNPVSAAVMAGVAARLASIRALVECANVLGRSLEAVVGAVPRAYVTLTASVILGCYAMLAALGAAAYRALSPSRGR